MLLKIFTDGGSKGNPGPASIGVVFYLDGKIILQHKEKIGIATNNDAEYRALTKALETVKDRFNNKNENSDLKIEIYSDSKLMVNQVNGLFKVKNNKIKEYILKIRGLEQEVKKEITYHYIPREQNTYADMLVNQV
ncbi:hypothetical protein B6D29_02560 [Microgenomates bacterium UTCPR1]|nr:MAG: hypothetical protein B6D29_02560 [Microgenomates bacterium UTCPR1]